MGADGPSLGISWGRRCEVVWSVFDDKRGRLFWYAGWFLILLRDIKRLAKKRKGSGFFF